MSTLPTAGLAGDAQSLAALRGRAATDPKAAVREVAKQFEALFMQELMKSMRAATLSSGMLDNEGSKLGTDLLDQQFATQMTGLPGRPVRGHHAPAGAADGHGARADSGAGGETAAAA